MTIALQPLLRQLTARRIHLSAPDVGPIEEDLLLDAFRSGWIAPLGPHVDAFEHELAVRAGRRHAVALNSGTAALHLGLLELGAGPATVVIVPTMAPSATANAVTLTRATPIVVDCETLTGNLDPALLEEALQELKHERVSIAAVVTADLLGRCADYDTILPMCARAGVPVLEDATEGLGAEQRGRPAGAFGLCAAVSVNPNMIMSTTDGGAVLTDDRRFASRVRYLSSRAHQPVTPSEDIGAGYEDRFSNLLAAIGRGHLQRLDELIEARQRLRDSYVDLFAGHAGVQIFQHGPQPADSSGQVAPPDAEDNCSTTAVLVDSDAAGWEPEDLANALAAQGFEARPLSKPMHRQPQFATSRAFLTGAADKLFKQGLTLPSDTSMSRHDVARVQETIGRFLAGRQ